MGKKSDSWLSKKNMIALESCTFKQTICSQGRVLKPFQLMNKDGDKNKTK